MEPLYKVAAFFGRHNFDVNGPNINTVIDCLLFEMKGGLEKDPVLPPNTGPALDMIPTWIFPPEEAPKNKKVIVIDAGGTNFRSCLVHFDEKGVPTISDLEKQAMPATDREYSKAEFFETIASFLDHLKDKADRIGFCFSYAMKISPDGDGEVIQFSKEIKAPEVIGSFVGKNLSEALVKRGWKKPEKIMLLNDTAAALLAGASTAVKGRRYDSYVGFIYGTGMNSAYIEYEPIPKIQNNKEVPHIPAAQIVVCESGKSNKVPRSKLDDAFAKTTNVPEIYLFEKMCSGAYFGALASLILRTAANEGLFSKPVNAALQNMQDFTPADMDKFFYAPHAEDTLIGGIAAKGTEDDRELIFRLLDALVRRAAKFAAANIAASVIKSGKGKNPALPVCVLAEGTTFLKMHNMRNRTLGYLNTVLTEERGIYFELISIDNAVTFGSAIAGLL
ncbi:hexokinase [Treponema phagedenis]|uniref:Hexokinase n=1 Tax=Treponema phagedenis TaxID=162 RepID=A0A0B7GQK8_TREPH|nr:hexokinase [Treponema phagedenis]EFW38446.1 Hexokinase [Treponema phagedenis F0421]NVP25551.1 hexokinase [Treponema phagedenis]QEJ94345.1 hexokinase [Treponema phagedenis]QEJ97351.1 hexokinase [Treponema phagedenis]QEK01737.1 hexokinase [Treponema phagedenis]